MRERRRRGRERARRERNERRPAKGASRGERSRERLLSSSSSRLSRRRMFPFSVFLYSFFFFALSLARLLRLAFDADKHVKRYLTTSPLVFHSFRVSRCYCSTDEVVHCESVSRVSLLPGKMCSLRETFRRCDLAQGLVHRLIN